MQMQMQIPASSSYRPSTSLTPFPTAMEGSFDISPGIQRVISSPSKPTLSLRDAAHLPLFPNIPATATTNTTTTACIPTVIRRCHSHHRMEHEHLEQSEGLLPTAAYLRDSEYLTKQAIKQMAEHRVLIDASRNGLPNKSTLTVTMAKTKRIDTAITSGVVDSDEDDDEYAWYFKNPHRYLWRPRTSGGRMRPAVGMHGELGVELNAEANKSLFASYLTRHYGLTMALDGEHGTTTTTTTTTTTSHHLSPPQAQTEAYVLVCNGNRAWSDAGDTATSEGSTAVHCFDEQWANYDKTASSPTLASASLHTTKIKRVSEDSSSSSSGPRRSTSSDGPVMSRMTQKAGGGSGGGGRRRWSSSLRLPLSEAPGCGPTHVSAVGSSNHHRRFSFLRLFSA